MSDKKVVVGICRYNNELFCKNWDGKGTSNNIADKRDNFLSLHPTVISCRLKPTNCGYTVTPKLTPPIRA